MENEPNMLSKGLGVMAHLAEHPAGCGTSEVARALGYPVSTAHRLLATLVAEGWAAQVPGTTRYRLGTRVLHAAEGLRAEIGLNDVNGALRRMVEEVGETAILGMLLDDRFMYMSILHGPGLLGIRGSAGQQGPLHCTATGKALLMALSGKDRERRIAQLELEPHTPSTATTPSDLLADLERSQQRGYSIADEEYEPDVYSVGLPLWLPEDPGRVYAICITAPKQRVDSHRISHFVDAMLETRALLRADRAPEGVR